MIPEQWHLYIVDLEPRVGTKPGKQSPALAIQPQIFGEAGLGSTVILPLTTKLTKGNNFPLRIRVPKGTNGLSKDSEILVDQILAWDHDLFRSDLGPVSRKLCDDVFKSAVAPSSPKPRVR